MTDLASQPDLPEPDDIAKAHSAKLIKLLRDRIENANGTISFADYMAQVLYEPGLGYYMAGAAKFGAEGDFITAPEVSPLFGAALAEQAMEVLRHTPGGILELGAGSGKLAASILINADAGLLSDYWILEPSADLVRRQQRYLEASLSAAQYASVRWLDTLPVAFKGVVIANEVMDALPVERFRIGDDVEQMFVSQDLNAVFGEARPALRTAVSAIDDGLDTPLERGYQSELCLLLKPWLASLSNCLEQGVLLLIDYGYPRSEYYLPERVDGTLTCYYRHRAHADPFFLPGLQDITAHVDFTAVVEGAIAESLDLLGYASQAAFLLDNNLLGLAEQALTGKNSDIDRIALNRAVKTLTLPGEMGERFQVMALGKGYDHALQGFATQDLSYRL